MDFLMEGGGQTDLAPDPFFGAGMVTWLGQEV